MRRWPRIATLVVVLASTSAWASPAYAQRETVAAEALFQEARRLMASDDPARACPKFAESQRLDPSPSTLLNLGRCYERLGRTATAWATYAQAASLAAATSRRDLVSVAQKHAAALEPDLVRLAIRVHEPVAGLEIRRDGVLVGPGEWDVAVPVDPGAHRVEASAPGKRPWAAPVTAGEPGETATIVVPALEDAPPAPAAPAPAPSAPARPAPATAAPAPASERRSPQKTIGLVTGGVGVAGLVVGTVFVLVAKSKYDDSRAQCPNDPNVCTAAGVSLRDDARRAGDVATIAYGAGAAALVAGAALFFTARPESRRGVVVAPTASGVLVDGRW